MFITEPLAIRKCLCELSYPFLGGSKMKRRITPQARNKRQLILKVATEVLAENGFQETTISQIARKANIAEGSIYDYFNNKEDLLFSIPEEQMENFLSTLHTHLHGMKDALPKLCKPIWCQLDFYENNQDNPRILLLDLWQNPKFNRSRAYRLIHQYSRIILEIIKKGKKEGEIRENVDPYDFRDLLTGNHRAFFDSRVYQGKVPEPRCGQRRSL